MVDRGGLESVTSHEDLARLLAEEFARADVSLRELETRAERAGGARLPRTTCADMLAGRRFPKKAVMMAFLRGCRVPDDQLPEWERAWDRVRIGRLPAEVKEEEAPPAVEARAEVTPPAVEARAEVTPPAVEARAGEAPPAAGKPWRWVVPALALVTAGAVLVVVARWEGEPERGVVPAQVVSDDGRAFPLGGSSRFTVTVDPANTGVRLIRRLDVGVGLQHATITVNGTPAGHWRPLLEDGVYKWRNQVVAIPPHLTAGRRSLTVVNTSVSASGYNEFLYTVEHRVGGVWSVADTVDVGRDHAASEAAHDYRVVGEDWAEVQTFAYPPRKEDWNVR
ncbi:hypothetical protein ACIBEJ_39865 [Nonomuraea sp. NPDC050790]|uniref:hypothetical protein n=1 Tax=Nonomuraea sp. NPDC050790 TaxID=3364371 RepID=UPI0037ADE2A3